MNRKPIEITLPVDLLDRAREVYGPRGISAAVTRLLTRSVEMTGARSCYDEPLSPDDAAILGDDDMTIDPPPPKPHAWTQTGATRWTARVELVDVPAALTAAASLGLVIESRQITLSALPTTGNAP
jgi:hypothetical protein